MSKSDDPRVAKKAKQAEHQAIRERYDEDAAAVFALMRNSSAPPEIARLAQLLVAAVTDEEALAIGRALLDPTHDAAVSRAAWMTEGLHRACYALSQRWLELHRDLL